MNNFLNRYRHIHYAGIVFILLAFAAAPCFGQTQTGSFFTPSPPPADPFKISLSSTPDSLAPGGKGQISVTFDIAPKHKIYVDRTSIVADNVPGLMFGTLVKPPSVEQKEADGSVARFYKNRAVFHLPFTIDPQMKPGPLAIPLTIRYQGCSGNNCFFPQEKKVMVSATLASSPKPAANINQESPAPSSGNKDAGALQKTFARFGLAGVLAAAFLWGFLASLTPCVYPMIPVTMSVIGSGSSDSLARSFILSLFYVLGMSLTYAGFGVAAAWSGGLFGAFSDHPAIRIFMAGILILLGLSMFDLFYIQVPSWLATRLGGTKGAGIAGVFVTGAAAGALVGPCVGPMLVGLLLYIAAIGSKIQGFFIMWSFSLGMGMLFLVIGTFSGAAASLPKAGTWMVKIKHFFGVVMLALSLYYISPLLPSHILTLCIAAFLIGTGVFAGAFDALCPESLPYDRIRKSVGILLVSLGIAYSARFVLEDTMQFTSAGNSLKKPAIAWQTDEAAGLALSRKLKKPVLLDFYADWCSACKRLDENTFSNPEVIQAAQNFITVKIDNSDTSDPAAKKLREKYGVVGLPTLLFLNDNGAVKREHTVTEYIDANGIMAIMRRVISAHHKQKQEKAQFSLTG